MIQAYKDFIQYSLDERKTLPATFDDINWQDFMEFCHRHSIMGVVFGGLEKSVRKIPQEVLFEWIGVVENLKNLNVITNKRVVSVVKWWQDEGRKCVILDTLPC